MQMDPQTILRFISAKASHPMKLKELASALEIPSDDYPAFRRTVKQLIASGDLVNLKRGRIGPAQELNVVVGTLDMTRSGTGFLVREGVEEDILIPSFDLHTALDGDKVMVRLSGHMNGRQRGQIVKVLERAKRLIVGMFKTSRQFRFVAPDNPRIHRDIYILENDTLGAKEGQKVVTELLEWSDPHLNPVGRITEVLGYPNDPGVDMLTVMRTYNLPQEFPPDVINEAEKAAATADLSKIPAGRLDLTQTVVYTIDPEDAKDHDDAISIAKTEEGYRLGVHIADVSAYVQEGTAMDSEAFLRGNSVYLPGTVVPMLPEILSNDVCSLRPDRRRLAFSCFMDFDAKGKMLRWELADTVIESRAKLSYEEVQAFFDTAAVTPKTRPIADSLLLARQLANLLTKRRFAEGSLDFDLPEAKIILNERGEVLELGHRVRLESHRLIEEFMLAANKAVALEQFRKGLPFLYRVHDKPSLEKLEGFSALVERFGYSFPVSANLKPLHFSRFLKRIEDAPEAEFINELMLRSMKKAVYQRVNIGHFGLAFTHYAHFTSPIRRYPDLLVHRLLRKGRKGNYPAAYTRKIDGVIDHVGQHCSETERSAEEAERQAVKVKQAAYMANHLGEEYNGVVSGVMPYGFFVRLDHMGVEGLIRVSAIDDDYYVYDEANYKIFGRRGKRSFRLGDAVHVGVLKVDTVRSEIDLYLPDVVQKKALHTPKPTKQERTQRANEKKAKRKAEREARRLRKR